MTIGQPRLRTLLTAAALLLAGTSAHAEMDAAAPVELSSEFVYKYLAAEVAGQRGNIPLASSLFFELAQSSRDPRLAERAAQAAAYGNLNALAIRAATLWAELTPDSLEALQAISQLLLSANSLPEAEPYLKKLLLTEKARASSFMHINGLLARHADKAAALKLVQRLAQPYQDLPEARFAQAHSAWGAGNEALALSELEAADKLRPGWEIAALLHGSILQKKSDASAATYYRSFLQRYPAANDVRLTYAKLLVSLDRIDEARSQFKQLVDSNPGNADMAVMVGALAMQMEDFTQADTYFQRALEHGFRHPGQIHLYLGQSAEKQQRLDDALAWYRKVDSGRWHFEAQLRSAGILALQNKLEEARGILHALPELDNEQQATALQFEASLLREAGQYQAAYELLERAIEELPNTTGIIYDHAMLAEKLQRFDIMEQQLRKLIQIKPDFAQAYNALGYSLADRNERLPEAASLIQKALELSPDDYFILDSMGWVQYRLGKLDEALQYLRRAYAEKPDPEIAAHLGEVLWHKGQREEALKTWQDALGSYPDNEVLRNTTKKFPQ